MKFSLLIIVALFCNCLLAQSDIVEIVELPLEVKETSGLLFYNDNLVTHNDSGNKPELYEIDKHTGAILRVVNITNATNIDWEDITQDDDYIYIADIGNNNGERADLNILKVSKQSYSSSDEVEAEMIYFKYSDQESLFNDGNSDFDAEAIFSKGDHLIILTKQWQRMGTVAYKIPKIPGDYSIEPFDSYQIDGLITGASYDSNNNQLFLIGYSQFLSPFFISILELGDNSIFNDEVAKKPLNIGAAQVEALSFVSENEIYISSEEFINEPLIDTKARLFKLTLDKDGELDGEEVEENLPEEESNKNENPNDLILYKMYGSHYLNYSLTTDKPITGMGVFDSSGTLISYTPLEKLSNNPLDISSYSSAVYYLSFFLIDGVIAAPFIKD